MDALGHERFAVAGHDRAGIDSGHHVAEEAPEATAAALTGFWTEVGWTAP